MSEFRWGPQQTIVLESTLEEQLAAFVVENNALRFRVAALEGEIRMLKMKGAKDGTGTVARNDEPDPIRDTEKSHSRPDHCLDTIPDYTNHGGVIGPYPCSK